MARSNFLRLLEAAENRTKRELGQALDQRQALDQPVPAEAPIRFEAPGSGNAKAKQPEARPARTVQDGHSLSEQTVYEFLWKNSGSDPNDSFREADGGYNHIRRKTGMERKTIKKALRSLRQKLAIEPIGKYDVEINAPTRFRVYCYRLILERRKSAGLEWCIHNRGGVTLCHQPTTTAPGSADEAGTAARPTRFTGETVAKPMKAALVSNPQAKTAASSDSPQETGPQETGPQQTTAIVNAFLQATGHSDDEAVRKLVDGCREKAPDATDEEIAHFIEQQAARVAKNRRITSLAGFLITQVPKCFEGESFRLYRQWEHQRQRATRAYEQAQKEQTLKFETEQRQILVDPNSSEEDKAFARQYLGIK